MIGEAGEVPVRCDRCRKPQVEGYYIESEDSKEENELSFTALPFLCEGCIVDLSGKFTMNVYGGSGKYLGKWVDGNWEDWNFSGSILPIARDFSSEKNDIHCMSNRVEEPGVLYIFLFV